MRAFPFANGNRRFVLTAALFLACSQFGCGGGDAVPDESASSKSQPASGKTATRAAQKSKAAATNSSSPKSQTAGKSTPGGKGAVANQPAPEKKQPVVKAPPPPAGPVNFKVLPLPEAVTSMSLSEDGRILAVSHQGASRVSLWNVVGNTMAKSISTPNPRSLMMRGNKLIVANDGDGTVSVFEEQQGNWNLTRTITLPMLHVVHLSAPRGKAFQNHILVTCHGDGPTASYTSSKVFDLNLDSKVRPKQVMRASVALSDFAGRIVFNQASFNLSPSGGITAYRWRDVVAGRLSSPVYRAGISQTPYLYQAHPGSRWIGNHMVFDGVPLKLVKKELGNIIIPDMMQRVIYALTKNEIVAYRLNAQLPELGNRRAVFDPERQKNFTGLYHHIYRHRRYMLDHPIAATHGETLRLFVIDEKTNAILSATTRAFVKPGVDELVVGAVPKFEVPTAEPSARNGAGNNGPGGKSPNRPRPNIPERGEYGIPKSVVVGQFLAHSLVAPNATFTLVTGPKGMSIVSGLLRWRPDVKAVGKHRVKIKVARGSKTSFINTTVEVKFRAGGAALASVKGVKKLKLETDNRFLTYGLDFESLLVLQSETLKRLGSDGVTVLKTMKFKDPYRFIAERKDVFVAVSNDPKRVDIIDKRSLRVRKQIDLTPLGVRVMDVMHLALHPLNPVCYVAIKNDIKPPRYRVLIVDEQTGKVRAPEDVIGTWVAVDPAGRYLYAGYKDIYERGSRFHINPGGRVIRMPNYGSIDWLISYSLRGSEPTALQIIRKAGGNGNGIRLSADGKRITYLSHVGYPQFSGNLAGIDPTNFKEGVTYKTKDAGATPKNLAYHPTLNLVAVAGQKPAAVPAAIFDRESAKLLPGKLPVPKGGLGGATIERLMFSPDGKSLVFLCSGADGIALFSLPLKLTVAERGRIRKGVTVVKPAFQPGKNNIVVRRSELDSLRIRRGLKTVSPKDIAKDSMPSVVLVQSARSTATGFVVGKKGYILTCAHAIPLSGKVQVVCQSTFRKQKRNETLDATIVRLDEQRDLALLKIKPSRPLAAVVLSSAEKVEVGEAVTVIGNPGLGRRVLTQTLTTGVVSSADRKIDGLPFIQTSAAVNPGNSGGPMFDSHGHVLGLIVLKANTDSTAFAVPSKSLREFLLAATKRNKRTK